MLAEIAQKPACIVPCRRRRRRRLLATFSQSIAMYQQQPSGSAAGEASNARLVSIHRRPFALLLRCVGDVFVVWDSWHPVLTTGRTVHRLFPDRAVLSSEVAWRGIEPRMEGLKGQTRVLVEVRSR